MKLKALKPHYFETKFIQVGTTYMSDNKHGQSAVGNGLCEEIKMPTREDKKAKDDEKKFKEHFKFVTTKGVKGDLIQFSVDYNIDMKDAKTVKELKARIIEWYNQD